MTLNHKATMLAADIDIADPVRFIRKIEGYWNSYHKCLPRQGGQHA